MGPAFPLFLLAAMTLDQRLARWKPVDMPFDASHLTARERQLVNKLAEACQLLDDIFWRQNDPEGLALYKTNPDPKLKRLLRINGGRFDLLDGHAPFVGSEPMPPGRALYPKGVTRADIEQYVTQHPASRAGIYSGYTVVRRRGGELEAIPYHVEYKPFLDRAAAALREAASLSDDTRFAHFLRLRADALLSDDYFPSDLAWLDLQDPKFDVIFAPYETYLDDVLGVKTSYGSAVLIRNEPESRQLAVFIKYIPDLQNALPVAPEAKPSKAGHLSPMEVVDSPFRGGDLLHGYQAVADNLPNDPRIHAQKGSKKIFFKNFMDARVNYVVLPLAKRLFAPAQAPDITPEGYLHGTLLHEISHGLGPAFARVNGKQVDIRESVGPIFSGLEEAKADGVGLFGVRWLAAHGVLTEAQLRSAYASHVADLFRALRFGTAEAHGQAEIMEFNFLAERRAILYDRASNRYSIDYGRMPAAIDTVARELLEIEAAGDGARAERWFARYRAVSPDLSRALASVSDIPVDIDPVFSLKETVE